MGPLYIGTSGWSYNEWKDDFYEGTPRAEWLARYAASLDAVEINASFYHRIKAPTLRHWRDVTPPGFRFTLKASRFLTHMQRLRMTAKSIGILRAEADILGGKLTAVLWQLPVTFKRDFAALEAFAARLDKWKSVRHAIEFRHPSWFDDETAKYLSRHRIAVVQSHAKDWPMWDTITTDLVYVRLHGGSRLYASAYRTATLGRWAQRVIEWRREGRAVHVYFDNTEKRHALRNAFTFVELCNACSPEEKTGKAARPRRSAPALRRRMDASLDARGRHDVGAKEAAARPAR